MSKKSNSDKTYRYLWLGDLYLYWMAVVFVVVGWSLGSHMTGLVVMQGQVLLELLACLYYEIVTPMKF